MLNARKELLELVRKLIEHDNADSLTIAEAIMSLIEKMDNELSEVPNEIWDK